jgi:hypothetical protein
MIRKDIKALRNRNATIEPDKRCMLSNKLIVSGPFYLFPNGYAYLQEEVSAKPRVA